MNTDQIRQHLRDLPPQLEQPIDRYDQVRSRVMRHRRRRTAGVLGGGAVVVVIVAGVVLRQPSPSANDVAHDTTWSGQSADASATPHVATDPPPGGQRITKLSRPLTSTATGSLTIDLGSRPKDATSVSTAVWCLSRGTFRWPDGSSVTCGAGDVVSSDDRPTSTYDVTLDPGQDDFRVRATVGMSWQLVTTYVDAVTTPWGVNARGQTYGVDNESGQPDLTAVVATNGRSGYASADQLADPFGDPEPTSPAQALEQQQAHAGQSATIPVYQSDGTTVIGQFAVQPGQVSTN